MDRLITGEVKRIQDGIRNEIKTLKKNESTIIRISIRIIKRQVTAVITTNANR